MYVLRAMLRDPRLVEIDLLMDLEQHGSALMCSRLRDDGSYVQVGGRKTVYGLDPGRLRDLLLGLVIEGAVVGPAVQTDGGGFHEDELNMERNRLVKSITGGSPMQIAISHAGRVRLWSLRDALLRDPDVEPMGLLSKAAWERAFPVRLQWATKDEPLALILVDFDNFKSVNEVSYQTGDDVLRVAFALVKNLVGSRGQVYRWGGEEVAVLVPKTSLELATRLAEELRAAIEMSVGPAVPALGRKQTASFGVAAFTERLDPKLAFGRVDDLVKRAKAEGKNRVIAADSDG